MLYILERMKLLKSLRARMKLEIIGSRLVGVLCLMGVGFIDFWRVW